MRSCFKALLMRTSTVLTEILRRLAIFLTGSFQILLFPGEVIVPMHF